MTLFFTVTLILKWGTPLHWSHPLVFLWLHHVPLAGHCAALPVGQGHVTCEGRLHHVWVPKTAAHVPHGDARDDQPHPVHRWVLNSQILFFFFYYMWIQSSGFKIDKNFDKLENPLHTTVKTESQVERTACAEAQKQEMLAHFTFCSLISFVLYACLLADIWPCEPVFMSGMDLS